MRRPRSCLGHSFAWRSSACSGPTARSGVRVPPQGRRQCRSSTITGQQGVDPTRATGSPGGRMRETVSSPRTVARLCGRSWRPGLIRATAASRGTRPTGRGPPDPVSPRRSDSSPGGGSTGLTRSVGMHELPELGVTIRSGACRARLGGGSLSGSPLRSRLPWTHDGRVGEVLLDGSRRGMVRPPEPAGVEGAPKGANVSCGAAVRVRAKGGMNP